MLRIGTPNGETAVIEDFAPQREASAIFASARSADFDASINIGRSYWAENGRAYSAWVLKSYQIDERGVREVIDGRLDERVGMLIPISALCTRDHPHAQDEAFELIASAAYDLLLADDANASVVAPSTLDGRYLISDFYPENSSVLIVRRGIDRVLDLVPYLPRLFCEGYASPSRSGELCAYLIANPPALKRRIKIKPVADCFLADGYIEHLYRDVLPFERSPLAQFVLLYQVFEMLMQSIFDASLAEFKSRVADFAGTPSDLRQISEALRDVTSERDRIRICIDAASLSPEFAKELASRGGRFLQACGKSSIPQHIGHLLYDVRNVLLHSYRQVPAPAREEVVGINEALIAVIPSLLVHGEK